MSENTTERGKIAVAIPKSTARGHNLAQYSRRKKAMLLALLLLAAAAGYLFVSHDDAWYGTTIAVVETIETTHTQTQAGTSIGEEKYYVQHITAHITNGPQKGQTVSLTNQYSDSGVRDEAYRRGDKLFIQPGRDGTTGKIIEQKRDTLVYLLAAALFFGMLAIAGMTGLLAALSLLVNIALLTAALLLYQAGWNLFALTAVLMVLFTLLSLLVANGWNRCSGLCIAVTLLSLALTAGIFLIVRAVSPPLQYQMMEYTVVPDDLSALFFCEILVGGLGAVMDVAISLISTADELLIHNPNLPYPQLRDSVQAVGDDIMGTMVNVLFFTYICGGLPEILLMLRNNLTMSFVWEYVLSFELVRFLTGSIGLVLAIPVSQLVLRIWVSRRRIEHDD